MPYYFGVHDPGWDDLDNPPHVKSFHYLPPPEFGGSPDPVHFSDTPPAPQASTPDPIPPQRTLWDRLLGRRRISKLPAWEARKQEEMRRLTLSLALNVAALRQIDVTHVYGRYDGGNDEGFAWLDHAVTRTGEKLSVDDLASRLVDTDLLENFVSMKLLLEGEEKLDRVARLRSIVSDGFAVDCAARLLGSGFGTGEYWLYGAFTVDTDRCTIVDDRNADPIVENIQLQT